MKEGLLNPEAMVFVPNEEKHRFVKVVSNLNKDKVAYVRVERGGLLALAELKKHFPHATGMYFIKTDNMGNTNLMSVQKCVNVSSSSSRSWPLPLDDQVRTMFHVEDSSITYYVLELVAQERTKWEEATEIIQNLSDQVINNAIDCIKQMSLLKETLSLKLSTFDESGQVENKTLVLVPNHWSYQGAVTNGFHKEQDHRNYHYQDITKEEENMFQTSQVQVSPQHYQEFVPHQHYQNPKLSKLDTCVPPPPFDRKANGDTLVKSAAKVPSEAVKRDSEAVVSDSNDQSPGSSQSQTHHLRYGGALIVNGFLKEQDQSTQVQFPPPQYREFVPRQHYQNLQLPELDVRVPPPPFYSKANGDNRVGSAAKAASEAVDRDREAVVSDSNDPPNSSVPFNGYSFLKDKCNEDNQKGANVVKRKLSVEEAARDINDNIDSVTDRNVKGGDERPYDNIQGEEEANISKGKCDNIETPAREGEASKPRTPNDNTNRSKQLISEERPEPKIIIVRPKLGKGPPTKIN